MTPHFARQREQVNHLVDQSALVTVIVDQPQERQDGGPKICVVGPDATVETVPLHARSDDAGPGNDDVRRVVPMIPRERWIESDAGHLWVGAGLGPSDDEII